MLAALQIEGDQVKLRPARPEQYIGRYTWRQELGEY
jgi:hypothetical protein